VLIAGLVIQTASLCLLLLVVRRQWLTYVGAVFLTLAILYHGLNEILLWIFPDRDPYRHLISSGYLNQFVLLVSIAIAVATVSYTVTLQLRPPRTSLTGHAGWGASSIGQLFDWRLMIALLTPLLGLTLMGGYYVAPTVGVHPLQIGNGLALQYLLITVVVASFAVIVRFGSRLLLPVLLLQSAAIAIAGQRLEILVAAVMLLYALSRTGVPTSLRQLSLGVGAALLIGLVLTSARAAEGRISTTAGGVSRISFLIAGIANIGSEGTRTQVASDLGYRLDGNSFGALELQALDKGSPPLGFRPLLNDVLLAVPSFLNPGKDTSPVESRSEKDYAEIHLRLPLPFAAPGVREDILPTQLGATVGFWGTTGMVVAALVLGVAFGLADRWLLRKVSPIRLIVGLGLLSCVLFYERSWDVYPVTFRGIVILLPLIWLLQVVRRLTHPSLTGGLSAPSFSDIG
jgi:hypothetical protein